MRSSFFASNIRDTLLIIINLKVLHYNNWDFVGLSPTQIACTADLAESKIWNPTDPFHLLT